MQLATDVATSRLIAQQHAMDVLATNISNAATPGFKAERVLFSDWLARQEGAAAPRGGEAVAYTQDRATYRDRQPGALSFTSNPLDLATASDGFFTVMTPQGPRLTRAGHFAMLGDGTVADVGGNALLDTRGNPIQLAAADTKITVTGDGTIKSENGTVGRIGVVKPDDANLLRDEGDRLVRAETPTAQVDAPKLMQGAVEQSNVQPVLETTRMMTLMREFQFVSQFVQAESDRQQSAIEKIAAPPS